MSTDIKTCNEHKVIFFARYPYLIAMIPAMHEMKRLNIAFDVYVPKVGDEDDAHLSTLVKSVNLLKDQGIEVLTTVPANKKYDILYSAYPGFDDQIVALNQVKYRVKFCYYAGAGNKPYLFRSPWNTYLYDFALCLSKPDEEVFSAYIKSFCIGNIKLSDFKRERNLENTDKKTILYLPSWGNRGQSNSSIGVDIAKKLIDLQDKYNICLKMHHNTATGLTKKEVERRKLFSNFTNVYDEITPTSEILNDVDLVISDLSSVAFDAIAGDVPLALFGLGNPVIFGDKLCLHQQLVVDDIVPGTNDVNELDDVIERALRPEYFEKQQLLKKEMFPIEGHECLNAFISFQDDLFNDRVSSWYMAARKSERVHLTAKLRRVKESYEKSTSWRMTAIFRGISKLAKKINQGVIKLCK